MMILMNCDRTLRKKPNENTNVTEILSLESVVRPFSTLHSPIPFWGIVKWRLPLCKKKEEGFFCHFLLLLSFFFFFKWNSGITRLFKWTNGIMNECVMHSPSPSKCSIILPCINICIFWSLFKTRKNLSMLNIMTVQYHKERLSRRSCRFFRIFERTMAVHF